MPSTRIYQNVFDQIDHEKLLDKIGTFASLRRQIKAWLKSGVIEGKDWFATEQGTPQGGVISPLLANIALHGMEEHLQQLYPYRYPVNEKGQRQTVSPPKLVRYADDFVVLHQDLDVVQGCQVALADWLKDMGLTIHPEKTRITHTLTPVEGNVGFDFLGYHFQQHKVGAYRASRVNQGNYRGEITSQSLGFKLFVTPSAESLKQHLANVREIIKRHSHAPQAALIKALNPVIRGWARYFGYFNARDQLSQADFQTYQKLRAWAIRRCSGQGTHKVAAKYWRVDGQEGWRFAEDEVILTRHTDHIAGRFVSLNSAKSPFDGDWAYWAKRMGHYPGIPERIAKLLQRQKGKCALCGLHITFNEPIEVDHIQPKILGGKDNYKNLQLVHGHCHDQKTAVDGSLSASRTQAQFIEEPDEAKVSRPVLKESSLGRPTFDSNTTAARVPLIVVLCIVIGDALTTLITS
ncbi:MAG: reverse transcriptase domain-containing protein [Leptolyngbyaceae cyanobacterium bins.59]|nr:reverse transcriptase domain-containing protein [Leptolyngbyaceae cyanobacterium bins.59]